MLSCFHACKHLWPFVWGEQAGTVAGEDDDDLYESLARARRAADKQQKQGGASIQDTMAEQLASRRDQDEAHQAMDTDTDRPAGSCLARSIWLQHSVFCAAWEFILACSSKFLCERSVLCT